MSPISRGWKGVQPTKLIIFRTLKNFPILLTNFLKNYSTSFQLNLSKKSIDPKGPNIIFHLLCILSTYPSARLFTLERSRSPRMSNSLLGRFCKEKSTLRIILRGTLPIPWGCSGASFTEENLKNLNHIRHCGIRTWSCLGFVWHVTQTVILWWTKCHNNLLFGIRAGFCWLLCCFVRCLIRKEQ